MLSPADSQVVSQDPAMPGLAVLLDPSSFLSRLRTACPGLDLRGATPTYLRYKPGTSCMAGFRLDVGGQPVDVYARALRVGDEGKLRKLTRPGGLPGPLGPGHVVLPDGDVAVFVFPNDDELPSLRVLGDPEDRRRLLRKLLGDGVGGAREVRTLAYKPERRFVGRVTTDGGSAAVLRFYTPAGYELATRNAKLLGATPSVRVPARLGRSARGNVVAVEWLPGRSLYELLVQGPSCPNPSASVRQVGAAVARLARTGSPKLRPRTREAEVAGLMATAQGIAALSAPLAKLALDLAHRVSSAMAGLPTVRRPMHGDLYAKQVIVGDDGGVALIDTDGAVLGDPASDLANFAAHLERHAAAGHLKSEAVTPAVDALVNAYESEAADSVRPRVGIYVAAQLLRVAPHPFRAREPNWPEQMGALLTRATELLDRPCSESGRSHLQAAAGYRASGDPAVAVNDPFDLPSDPKLAFAKHVLDPATMEANIAESLSAAGVSLSETQVLRTIRVTRHKPGRRCLVEYEFAGPDDNPNNALTVIGKARAKGMDGPAHRVLKTLWRNGFRADSPDGLCVPRPLGTIPRLHMILQQKVPGVPLTQLIGGPEGLPLAGRAAELIYKLHAARLPTQRRHTIEDELRILNERLPRIYEENPRLRPRIERLLSGCQRVASRSAGTGTTTGIHRDFYPDQLIVDGDEGRRLYLLDLDLFADGDPALDVGNFVAHLTELALRTTGDPTAFADREHAMVAKYVALAGSEAGLRDRIEVYATLTLARHVHISTLFPARRPLTQRLLDVAQHHLNAFD